MSRPLPVAFLVSGEGTTLEAITEEVAGGYLPARIVLVVSDRPHAPAIERARRHGLPTVVLPLRGVPEDKWTVELDRRLHGQGAELVVLAGFLSVLPAEWVTRWAGRVINVHPSLLPRYGGRGFYGSRVHSAVLTAGDRETGATVHLVTSDVDAGPRLLQKRLPVDPDDTVESLRDRVHPVEIQLLSEAIRNFADGRWPLPYVPPAEPALPAERRDAA